MFRSALVVPMFFLAACGGSGVGGHIASVEFSPRVAYSGGPFVLLIDNKVGCNNLGWVDDRFTDGVSPRDNLDFTALLLVNRAGWSEEVPQETIAFHGVHAWGLINEGGSFEAHHGREGTVFVDKVGDGTLDGGLSVSFAHDGVAGSFSSEFCQTLENAG